MFSLRVKLVIAIGAIVSMASFPLIWMGYRDVYDHSIEAARKRFVSLSRMLEEDLRLSVLSEQSLVTQKISIEMDDIRSELDAIESWWRAGVLEKKDDVFTYMLEKWDTHTAVLRPDGTFVRTSPAVEALYGRNGADWLGVPFRTIVSDTDRNFQRDFRSFFRVRNERGEEKPYLTVFRKIDGVIAVVMQNVDYLEVSPAAQRQLYAERLSDRVASLDFPKDASLAVVDGEGRNIVWRGSFPMAWSAPTERLALNEGNTVTSGTVTLGGTPYLTLERRFPALNWSIRTAVPVSTITEPASRHALELVRIALFLFGVISVLGIALVTRILNPLGRISATAKRLESYRFDDAGGEGLSSLMESLPAKRRDEIGNVARAFSQMLVALDKNVRDLKASLAKQHGIEGELNAAREIQTSMLPKDDAAFHAEGFDAAAKMVAAKEVGGDLFDVIRLPGGRRALVLGDVSGKGVSAALMMSVTLTLIRNALSNGFLLRLQRRRIGSHERKPGTLRRRGDPCGRRSPLFERPAGLRGRHARSGRRLAKDHAAVGRHHDARHSAHAGERMMLTRREALLFLSLLAAGASAAKASQSGTPKNVILVTGGDYVRYRRIFEATIAGLEALGLVRDVPHVADSDREDTSDLWEALTHASGALRFLPDGHYSYQWDGDVRAKVNADIAERLRTRRDVDMIFTFGTEAGLDIPKLTSEIPVLSLGSSNPVQTGIVASETDSGRENLHALVRRDPYGEEVRGFHALRPFRRLALVVAASSVEKAGAGEVEASCRSLGAGFECITYSDDGEGAAKRFADILEAVREAHRRGCDAVVFHWFRATSDEYAELTRLLAEYAMASFAQSGEEFVEHGILLGVGNESFEGYGAFEADVIRRVLEGTSPRKCPQVFAERTRFVINLVSALEIGWTPDFGVLVTMEKAFVTQK